eukprot:m.2036 g.2036  ORF g.2036 m.2036 type:complete len:613 (+) comp8190_c0_seq1:100-1938(+)
MDEERELLPGNTSLNIVTEPLTTDSRKPNACYRLVASSGLIFFTLPFIVTIIMSTASFKHPESESYIFAIYIYLTVFLLVSNLVLASFLCPKPYFRSAKVQLNIGDSWRIKTARELRWGAYLACFMAVGTLVYSIWKLVVDALCGIPTPLKAIGLIYGGLKCLFIVLLSLFLRNAASSLFYRYSLSGLGLVLVIGCNLSVWTFEMSLTVFEGVAKNLTFGDLPAWFICLKEGEGEELSNIAPYLYPWVVEFSFATTVLLLWLWYASGRVHVGRNHSISRDLLDEEGNEEDVSMGLSDTTQGFGSKVAGCSIFSCSCCRCKSRLDCGMVVGIALAILFSGTILTASALENDKSANKAAVLGYYGVRLATAIIMIICCFLTYFGLKRLEPPFPILNYQIDKQLAISDSINSGIEYSKTFTYSALISESTVLLFGDWLTIIAAIGSTAYEGFSFYATVIASNDKNTNVLPVTVGPRGLKTISAATCAVEITVQVITLIKVRRFFALTKNQIVIRGISQQNSDSWHIVSRNLQQVALVLVSANVCFWATDSIFEIQSTNRWAVESTFYSAVSWNFIKYLFYSLIMFFRFYSAVIFFNLWARSRTFYHRQSVSSDSA